MFPRNDADSDHIRDSKYLPLNYTHKDIPFWKLN